jgi:RNA recognition motif-containing protein
VVFHQNQPQGTEEHPPSPVLIVRGLDFATTEESLRKVFSKLGNPIEVRLIKDKVTQASRGFGFLEFSSTEEATYLLSKCGSLNIDGRFVKMGYSTKERGESHHNKAPDMSFDPIDIINCKYYLILFLKSFICSNYHLFFQQQQVVTLPDLCWIQAQVIM